MWGPRIAKVQLTLDANIHLAHVIMYLKKKMIISLYSLHILHARTFSSQIMHAFLLFMYESCIHCSRNVSFRRRPVYSFMVFMSYF